MKSAQDSGKIANVIKNLPIRVYMNYYIRCMQLVRAKGIIILDNMLWSGSVIEPKDEDAKKLREVGDYIQQDDRVINMLLPIRDGLMVCYKK